MTAEAAAAVAAAARSWIAGAANGAWAGSHEQEALFAEGLKLGSGRRISSASTIVGCVCKMPAVRPGRGRGRSRCARRAVAVWESLGWLLIDQEWGLRSYLG
jgi:hypothetical protein